MTKINTQSKLLNQQKNDQKKSAAILILTLAGLANGFALWLYADVTSDKSLSTSTIIVLVSLLMIVIAPLLDWIFNNNIPLPRHYAGFAAALAAIYLLR